MNGGGCIGVLGVLILALLLLQTLKPDQARRSSANEATSAEWYEGGTLHRANLGAWRASTYANRLATCADMVCATRKDLRTARPSMDEIRGEAIELEACISEVAKGDPKAGNFDAMRVDEIAANCLVLLRR